MIPVARLRIVLDEIEPEIWRRVEVPASITLKQLHEVIQALFAWQSYHLFEFEVAGRRYGIPDDEFGEPVYDARNIRIETLVSRGIVTFDYLYDFGDNWLHRIEIEAADTAAEAARLPKFIEGARRAPPEDVGGPPGYDAFLEAIADPDHEDHEEMLSWCGGAFDPEEIDAHALQRRIEIVARRIAAALARRKPRPTQ